MKKYIFLVLINTYIFSVFGQTDTASYNSRRADTTTNRVGKTDTGHVYSEADTTEQADTLECASIVHDGKVWASIYQQRAAEYRALCFQAYNFARLRVDLNWTHYHIKPYAIITDIDETLLDNSPYNAQRALSDLDYDSTSWKQWTAKAICDTVPGAPSFLKYAASKGITIFYITNRDEDERSSTLKNLQLYGLPNADSTHLLLKQKSSSKEARRRQVLETHEIMLLCGDNLADFDTLYDNHPTEENRKATTEKLMKEFGDRYIIIPNPAYDDWESAMFNYKDNLSKAEKDSVIKTIIKVAP